MPDTDPLGLAVVLLLVVSILPLIGTVALVIRRVRASTTASTKADGIHVTLVASQAAIKGVPWLAWVFNLWTPKLVLHLDGIEYRIFLPRRRAYAEIAQVDYVRSAIGTSHVVVDFPDNRWSFLAWVPDRNAARDLIRRFRDEGCAISPRAAGLLRA